MRVALILVVAILCSLIDRNSSAEPTDTPTAPSIHFLDQGWSSDERQQFYYTAQGSQLIPYDWFLALNRVGKDERFASIANLERLRFISQPADSNRNPDGLPIGLVIDDNPKTVVDASIKQSFYGPEFELLSQTPLTNRWLGLTCAACHTANIEYQGKVVRIDGGAAMADVQAFLSELSQSVDEAVANDAVFDRFARVVLVETGTGYSDTERDALRERLKSYSPALSRLVRRGTGKHPYGFGRLDAFGAILNEVCDTSLNIPENYHPSDAPASYPFLWGAPELDWVQWNGTADSPIGRNVGEVIGVFGQVNLAPEPAEDRYKSTAHFENLVLLEDHVQRLRPPHWPVGVFGELDHSLIAQGRTLFMQNCASCHAVRDIATNQFPLTKPNRFGKQFVRTHMIKLDEIGTDRALAENFAIRTASPGTLMAAGAEKVRRPAILKLAVAGAIEKKIAEHQPPLDVDTRLHINGYREPSSTPPNPLAYKARPLEGIWATAPFLHNGSVPNLYELLLPASKRSKSFVVGNRSFDPKRVGFVTSEIDGGFEFEVEDGSEPIPGNSNLGHDGHGNSPKIGYTEIFEDGEWREFTDSERWALVEFMKSQGPLEVIPAAEPDQISSVVSLTVQQLRNRYPGGKQVLRGVHAKDHGCVTAKFEVAADLPEEYKVGVFAKPGRAFEALVRFSNAATLVLPDDSVDKTTGKPSPGSRGMAIKLLGIEGTPLVPVHGALTQDFLLVNHPVFAFANVEDYEVLSQVLADQANREDPSKFFGLQIAKGGAAAERAKKSLEIVSKIRAATVATGAYQPQPGNPVDCRYFSGAPFLFGDAAVMKFSVAPRSPATTKPNAADPNYLRNALIERLEVREGNEAVVFDFQVQVRAVGGLDISRDIENVCNDWPEDEFPFKTIATLTIPPQDFDSPDHRELCESLVFSPWHGVVEHRPLGGINRMRRAVYETSSAFRHKPKEPAGN